MKEVYSSANHYAKSVRTLQFTLVSTEHGTCNQPGAGEMQEARLHTLSPTKCALGLSTTTSIYLSSAANHRDCSGSPLKPHLPLKYCWESQFSLTFLVKTKCGCRRG